MNAFGMFAAPRAPSGSVENEYAVKKSCMFYKHKKYIPVMLAKIKKKKKKSTKEKISDLVVFLLVLNLFKLFF